MESTITQAIATLLEEIPDITKWSRTKKILDDGKLVPVAFKRKYESISDSEESSSLTISTTSNTNTNAIDSNTITTNTNFVNRNWEYLEQSLSKLIEGTPIPWEQIYDDDRVLGLFGNYIKWNTMKSNYYRWKK